MSRLPKFIVIFVIPAVIIAAGAAIAFSLISNREQPETKERIDRGVLVETTKVETKTESIEVEATGSVKPSRRLVVQPQVTGRVVWVNDQLVPGGLIPEGEPLFRVDARDYRLAIEQRETAVEQARSQLQIEAGQQMVAQREWDLFKSEVDQAGQDPSLALRQPQMKSAEVNLRAMKSQLERTKLDLSRTTIRAPFNLMVESENVEVGQVVAPGSQAATVVGTDTFWVQVSVPMDRLQYLQIPGMNGTEGSEVIAVQNIGGQDVRRTGRIERLLGDVDPVGRMARILVAVEDPLNLNVDGAERGLPFLLGSYVTVEVDSARELQVAEIPRTALHGGDEVHLFVDGKLEIREVTVAWKRDQTVLVSQGLQAGDELVTSRIPTPLQGMKLRRAGDEQ